MSNPNGFYTNQAIPQKVVAEALSNATGKPAKAVNISEEINKIIRQINK